MEYRELVNHLSNRTSYTKREMRLILRAVAEVMQEAIGSGRDVQFDGVGKFLNLPQAQRVGGDPVTKKRMIIPATRRIRFEPCIGMKKAVRGSLKHFKDEDPEVKYGLRRSNEQEQGQLQRDQNPTAGRDRSREVEDVQEARGQGPREDLRDRRRVAPFRRPKRR